MSASHKTSPPTNRADRIFEAFVQTDSERPRRLYSARDIASLAEHIEAAWRSPVATGHFVSADRALRLVQDRADIDISGSAFNFVRSIRVFDVRYARQQESGRDGDCKRSANVILGTYGTQGDFAWHRSSIAALPTAHSGLEGWGDHCPGIFHRSVFVDWRDYQGNYGFEQVAY